MEGYGLRMLPPPAAREAPKVPIQWGETGPIISIGTNPINSAALFSAKEAPELVWLSVESMCKSFKIWEEDGKSRLSCVNLPPGPCQCQPANLLSCTSIGGTPYSVRELIRSSYPSHISSTDGFNAHKQTSRRARRTSYSEATSIASALLSELRAMAERYHGRPITQAVLTVPSDFGNEERRLIRDAALFAHLSPGPSLTRRWPWLQPTAFGLGGRAQHSHALILDVGSTAHAALLGIINSVIQVLARAYNDSLGGDAFTRLISADGLPRLAQRRAGHRAGRGPRGPGRDSEYQAIIRGIRGHRAPDYKIIVRFVGALLRKANLPPTSGQI
ncbi:hypothetical protein B0H15DRAFT_155820 [Mycena belliarum]|uniref:Uncharacterized protein n=1 Tax=Mycena belliarum TaxID=1033014 RepID=A0AAD6XPC8_9AGAR|nr:hypothetical protein B0H15DRAFT_155820 [Mycena belliae]